VAGDRIEELDRRLASAPASHGGSH
jgi:hypothetical protein